MATLTNTQISVTYVGLLKTSGNTILDSTPQQITDGSGNNSQLFLSTAKVGIGATPSGSDTLQVQGSISITGDGSNATTLTESGSGDFTIDVAGDLTLDADGGDILFKDAGTTIGTFSNSSTDFVIQSNVSDKDIIFKGNDDGSTITAMTIDMSAGGRIGIGTTSPSAKLHVSGSDSTASAIRQSRVGTVIWDQAIDSSGRLQWGTRASEGGTRTVRFGVDDDGSADFTGDVSLPDSKSLKFGDSDDLKIVHDGTLSSITNVTGDLYIQNSADDGDIFFRSDDGSGGVTEYFRLDGGNVNMITSVNNVFVDNKRAVFGDSADLAIYHNGTTNNIEAINGKLRLIQTEDDADISFESDDGSGGLAEYFKLDGANVRTLFSKNIKLSDSVYLLVGSGNDLQLLHNGTNSFIINETGNLAIRNTTDDGDITFESDDGSGGTTDYFVVDGGLVANIFYKRIKLVDNVQLQVGSNPDLLIYHDTSNSYIQADGTGDLIIEQKTNDKDIIFKSDDGSGGTTTYFKLDGATSKTIFETSSRHKDNVKLTLVMAKI